ncbi:MAG: hypothetical protein NC548_33360 [Lachnospiraceae bacterium]|nr:hypothetical protein [Lachnospiraceae bacterium]
MDTYRPVICVDKNLLDECCEKIIENTSLIKASYRRLIEMGVFTEKEPGFPAPP